MPPDSTFKEKDLERLVAKIPLPLLKKAPSQVGKKKIIVLAGPTAVGKTRHSLEIGKILDGEIISADSMQVYRGMDIGTAKASLAERAEVPHHLIDICDLDQRFNVMDFYKAAHQVITQVLARGKVPIVVGGTGFYIHALLYGPPLGPPSVPEVRESIEAEMKNHGAQSLYERLKEFDPEYAKTISSGDRHKIVRALEIVSLTNKKVSDFAKEGRNELLYNYRCWFLHMPRELLYPEIEMRCDQMIASGLIDEVRHLEAEGLRKNHSASQAIGYRQCLEFLTKEDSSEDFEQFVATFKRASRRYAKRQFTWFRKEPLFRWLRVSKTDIGRSVETIIQDYELSF